MACVLYDKDGNSLRCEIAEVEYYLQNGYQKNHPSLVVESELEPEADESSALEDELASLEDKVDAKEDEIRALAREKGIKRVGVKSIETLLEEIEAQEDAAED